MYDNASFGIRVSDANSASATAPCSISISAAPLNITTPYLLPGATVSISYSTTISASGGTGVRRWYSWSLPSGLTIGVSTGVISGTPDTPNTYSIAIYLYDDVSQTQQTFQITISGAPNGASCTSNAQCASGYCGSGTCGPAPSCTSNGGG